MACLIFITNNYRLFRKTIGQLKKLVKVVQFLKASDLFLSSKLPPLQNKRMQTAYSILCIKSNFCTKYSLHR